jgi:hypothetical protein
MSAISGMRTQAEGNGFQLFPRWHARFDLALYLEQEQRRVERAMKAARNVGEQHDWFVALPASERLAKVWEWVDEALEARAARLYGQPPASD